MASAIIIPIILVSILGLVGYLVYRFVLFDMMCKSTVNRTLRRYNIQKTPYQIVKEFHNAQGEDLSAAQIRDLEKEYRQTDPDQFLSMFDTVREKQRD